MTVCAECGAEHFPGTLFCDTCGAAVHPAAQAHVTAVRDAGGRPDIVRGGTVDRPLPADPQTPAPATALPTPPPESPALRVRIPHHKAELTLRRPVIQVGRADPGAGFVPELDLGPFGGQERGVSRRHATIQWSEDGFVIVDQHSSNGTWLDGTRLVAGYTYRIPPGATVRFGGLLVQLSIAD